MSQTHVLFPTFGATPKHTVTQSRCRSPGEQIPQSAGRARNCPTDLCFALWMNLSDCPWVSLEALLLLLFFWTREDLSLSFSARLRCALRRSLPVQDFALSYKFTFCLENTPSLQFPHIFPILALQAGPSVSSPESLIRRATYGWTRCLWRGNDHF